MLNMFCLKASKPVVRARTNENSPKWSKVGPKRRSQPGSPRDIPGIFTYPLELIRKRKISWQKQN